MTSKSIISNKRSKSPSVIDGKDSDTSIDATRHCSICCDSGADLMVLERCTMCREFVCYECVTTHLRTLNNVLEPKCPSCQKSWSDWETIRFATRTHIPSTTDSSSSSRNRSPAKKRYRKGTKYCDIPALKVWTKRVKECLLTNERPELKKSLEKAYAKEKREKLQTFLNNLSKELNDMSNFGIYYFRGVIEKATKEIKTSDYKVLLNDKSFARKFYAVRNQTQNLDKGLTKLYEFIAFKCNILKTTEIPVRTFRCCANECDGMVVVTADDARCSKCLNEYCKLCECAIERISNGGSDNNGTNETHVCDPTVLENVRALRDRDIVRQCPNCNVNVTKENGCNDMYCPLCSVFFKWTTGDIIAKTHNPDYVACQIRKKGAIEREFGDVECGGIVHSHVALRLFENTFPNDTFKLVNEDESFETAMFAYHEYDVHDMFNVMCMFYAACIEWKTTKNTTRSLNLSELRARYVKHFTDASDPPSSSWRRTMMDDVLKRPCIKNSTCYWKAVFSSDRSRKVYGYKQAPLPLDITKCVAPIDVAETTDIDEYVADRLFDIKMLDECEEKYYDTLLTFVKCCNDVFKAFTTKALELQSVTDRSKIGEFLQGLDDEERVEFDRHMKRFIVDDKTKYRAKHDIDAKDFVRALHLRKCDLQLNVVKKLLTLVAMLNDRVGELAKVYGCALYGVRFAKLNGDDDTGKHIIDAIHPGMDDRDISRMKFDDGDIGDCIKFSFKNLLPYDNSHPQYAMYGSEYIDWLLKGTYEWVSR